MRLAHPWQLPPPHTHTYMHTLTGTNALMALSYIFAPQVSVGHFSLSRPILEADWKKRATRWAKKVVSRLKLSSPPTLATLKTGSSI